MLIRDNKGLYRHKVKEAVGEGATANDILDYLFGDYIYSSGSDFVIREWVEPKNKISSRLNMFWAIPFTLLLSPFRYVVKGYIGWDDKTRLGRFILKSTGNLREI